MTGMSDEKTLDTDNKMVFSSHKKSQGLSGKSMDGIDYREKNLQVKTSKTTSITNCLK